ncbi:MAG: hypothetical protein KDK08_28545 [Rhizobiaceae bacterium]|nr:hypothetical protein [Rhizobiaceae bacterium]
MRDERVTSVIIGNITVNDSAVVTHRDSYLLDTLSVVSVRRPFFAPGVASGLVFGGFAVMFADLLYAGEIIGSLGAAIAVPMIATQIGQLKLLSRDLRGSELSGVVWGRYAALNQVRREIVDALFRHKGGTPS